jgi:transposase
MRNVVWYLQNHQIHHEKEIPNMSQRRKHVQGRRGEAFVKLIRDVPRDQIACVSIDVHKYYHQVMMHNEYGEILVPSFRIDIFQSGFERLCEVVDSMVAEHDIQVLFVGMEPTGHYYENLARHLSKRYPHLRLVNSYAVKETRKQSMLRTEKTDDIDLGAIGDLVLRNKCFPYQPLEGDHLSLQHWVRFREAKVKMRTALRNQIIGHLDRIFPGLARPNYRPEWGGPPMLFANLWACKTAQHLIRLCPDPRRLAAMEEANLRELFHTHNWRMGPAMARRIIQFARQVLLPDAEVIATRLPLLQADLDLLRAVDQAVAEADKQIAHYLAQTRGQILTHIKGIGTQRAAAYVAGIGNPAHYEHAGQTFKRSGLVSGRNDSGLHQRQGKDQRVTKVGDPHLRRALVEMTRGLCRWQPYFGTYREGLEKRGKHHGVATVATARKVNGVLFALMRDQSEFRPVDAQGRPIPPRASIRGTKKATTNMDSSKAKA